MKKYLAIILGVLFVLSFAASSYAVHAEIPSETQSVVATGATQITLGGELRIRGWYHNNIDGSKMPTDTNSQAWIEQRVRLSLDAQITPGVQGYVQLESNSGASSDYVWGTDDMNKKPTGLDILQAWILYQGSGLFGFPAGLKAGHMPFSLSEKVFIDHTKFGDDALVFFLNPTKQLHIALVTLKLDEASKSNNIDDLDAYVGILTYKVDDKNTLGLNYTYIHNADTDTQLSNIGLHANGNVSGLGYKGELDIQLGSNGSPSMDYKGYGIMLGLNYKVNPVNIRGSFAYGSGDDDTDDNIEDFQTFLGADQRYTLVYEYRVATTAGATQTGISNTTYYNLGLDYSPTKDLSTSLDAYILRASKTVSGVSKNAGWEVDAKVVYNVAKNLKYQVDAGYLHSGAFYNDVLSPVDNKNATVLRHMLTLSF